MRKTLGFEIDPLKFYKLLLVGGTFISGVVWRKCLWVSRASKNCFHWHTIPSGKKKRDNLWQTNKIITKHFLSQSKSTFHPSPLDRLSRPIKDNCMFILHWTYHITHKHIKLMHKEELNIILFAHSGKHTVSCVKIL